MNALSELLQQRRDSTHVISRLKRTYHRQFLPTSSNIRYNLVVASRSFFEVGDLTSRAKTVDILWRKVMPGGFLVLVETGSYHGHSLLMALRDYLIDICRIERQKYSLSSPINVFAPCTHAKECPLLDTGDPCNFTVKYLPLEPKAVHANEQFSFVVLEKAEGELAEQPRIVKPVLKRRGHVIMRVCAPDGQLRELVATKARQGTACLQLCRNSREGDFAPVTMFKLE